MCEHQYVECLREEFQYDKDEDVWYDPAFAWLCGRLSHRDGTLSTRRCEDSEIGKRYNLMLPPLSIGRNGE